jgi:hypothetical protein
METFRCANCDRPLTDPEGVCEACEEELRTQAGSWEQFAMEVGAEYDDIDEGVIVPAKQWVVVHDIVDRIGSEGGEPSRFTFYRMRAPFLADDGFRFKLTKRQRPMEKLQQGAAYPEFERDFIIKGNDESKVQAFIANQRIRELIQSQPSIHLQVIRPWWPPRGRHRELRFEEGGEILDVERLKSLHALFEESLTQLVRMGSASEEAP